MRYTIRRSQGSDDEVDAIKALDRVCFDACDGKIKIDGGYWWLVFAAGRPVAYAGMCHSHRRSNWGYLCRAGVCPSHRGNGLQKRLIKVRVNYARRLGWDGIVTDTSKGNHASSNSLIHEGFTLFNPTFRWSFNNANYWRLYL